MIKINVWSKAPNYYVDPVSPLSTSSDVDSMFFTITQKCESNFDEFKTLEEAKITFNYLVDREKRLKSQWGYKSIVLYNGNRRIDHWRSL